ncbi:hypothetical protein B7R22_17080 [Subtercola boreus]|uniref:Uncharacterized protein n=1 Tax=Subtercola boreus TaxID=120213 RepID=A0A3E0VRX2_9MICO|nr:hypothetical protein [Subtercola boreus]RFA12143.1 hypothetical protein B7R22_17080 [Subtercola boreus]
MSDLRRSYSGTFITDGSRGIMVHRINGVDTISPGVTVEMLAAFFLDHLEADRAASRAAQEAEDAKDLYTIEELDALPPDTVIRTAERQVYEKSETTSSWLGTYDGYTTTPELTDALPAHVLFTPPQGGEDRG